MPLNQTPTALNESAQDRMLIMEQLRKSGLLDSPELDDLKSKQAAGAGSLPQPLQMLAPMVVSVQQADR